MSRILEKLADQHEERIINVLYRLEDDVIKEVRKIKTIGKILIANKNNKFLSLKLILYLSFLINNKVKIINGINIPICFAKNNNGNLM